MNSLKMPSTSSEPGVPSTCFAPVIVATDGRDQSDAALVVGRLLARSPDDLRLATVIKPLPVLPDFPVILDDQTVAARAGDRKSEVTSQMLRAWDEEADVEIFEGDPASVITKLAHVRNAEMIVAGIGRHRVSDRIFGDETALRLIRMADVPVLAVVPTLRSAPARVVVACDFSEASRRAARLAVEIAAPNATIYLAHVAPRDGERYEWFGWGKAYRQDAGDALQRTREQIRPPKELTVQNIVLQGDPATELLAFAASVNADLIATGTHGYGFMARMLVGSVTTRLVRCATCSVLAVPRAVVRTERRTTVSPPASTAIPRDQWAAQLEAFSRQNRGRRGILEVDDPEMGAQAQGFDYPLVGIAFDRHDQQVDLMFGPLGGAGGHLSRGIGGVTSIDVLKDDRGHDLAIRIAHGPGQTLLTFA